MKHLSKITYLLLVSVATLFTSCSTDDDAPATTNELGHLQLVTTLANDQHTITLYTTNGAFQTGYNEVYFQIKDAAGNWIDNAAPQWKPEMKMMDMSHACPYSTIAKKEHATHTFKGYIVFTMAGSDMEHWELTMDYTVKGTAYTVSAPIDVEEAPNRVVESFKATDGNSYVLAMVAPENPVIGANDMKAVLYQMASMTSFVPVAGYTVEIDPRMPGMGNHSAPNNINLTDAANGMYQGKINFTMTGYWVVNLQLADASGNVIAGTEVNETNERSNIFFEVAF